MVRSRRVWGFMVLTLLAAARARGAEEPPVEVTTGKGSKLRFYGQLRLDAIYDDSRPDNAQSPLFVPSEDPTLGGERAANFALHPRLSRLGVDFSGPEVAALRGAKVGGKLELDFQNGGRESRAVPRYRHAYLQLAWPHARLLAGQTWDLISPLFPTVNADTLMWNAGNLGDRRAQLRMTWAPQGRFEAAAALGLTGAVDEKDLDQNRVRDGEESGLPHLQTRLGWSGKLGGRSGAAGVWGHWGREKTELPVAGGTSFTSSSLGVDWKLGLPAGLTVQGEAWTGENLSDFRGGAGQGVAVGSGEEIDARGGWLELGWKASDRCSLAVGATVDDPDDGEVPSGGRTRNSSVYLATHLRWGDALMIGLDLLHWETDFAGLATGDDDRANLYLVYSF